MDLKQKEIAMASRKATIIAPFFIFLIFASTSAKCQSNFLGSWNIVNTEYYLNKQWNLWGEVQTRSQKLTKDFYYHELKGGINYRPNKNFGFLLGTGQYATYSNGGNFKSPVLSHEFRLWEQITLVNNISRLKIEHRYRIEQRWRSDGYRNRFRYRINPLIPINKKTIENGTLYASVYDEIFITNRSQYFERNRVFAGLGYQFSALFTLQLGWINQFDYNSNNTSSAKNFLQTTLFFRLNQHNEHRNTHPSSMD